MFDVIVAALCLMQLVFPVNAHQNVNQKQIGSAPSPFTRPTFSIFRGLVPRLDLDSLFLSLSYREMMMPF